MSVLESCLAWPANAPRESMVDAKTRRALPRADLDIEYILSLRN